MKGFHTIHERAIERKGGKKALNYPKNPSPTALNA